MTEKTLMESPVCTICRVAETVDFPAGAYHLNLTVPFGVVRCKKCSQLFLSPRPAKNDRLMLMQGQVPERLKDYATRAANYSAVTDSRAQVFESRVVALMTAYMTKTGKPPASVLDVGASSGSFLKAAQEKGLKATGIEASSDGANAAARQGLPVARGLAEYLPFADNSFDIVHSNHVFEHLEDPMLAVQEIRRVLKPGGLVFIEVPNQFDNIMFHRDMLFRRIPQRERNVRSIHHLWFFSKKTLGLLLITAGFCDVRVDNFFRGAWLLRQAVFTFVTRLVGRFLYGGEIIQVSGWK